MSHHSVNLTILEGDECLIRIILLSVVRNKIQTCNLIPLCYRVPYTSLVVLLCVAADYAKLCKLCEIEVNLTRRHVHSVERTVFLILNNGTVRLCRICVVQCTVEELELHTASSAISLLLTIESKLEVLALRVVVLFPLRFCV